MKQQPAKGWGYTYKIWMIVGLTASVSKQRFSALPRATNHYANSSGIDL
jgi:hypothetical protein